MNSVTVQSDHDRPSRAPEMAVRHAIETLNSLDAETADHLNALSFVMMRVARADGMVCSNERHQMEEILIEHARVSAEHAVLVTEIACHRAELADCGSAYAISRGLRSRLGRSRRESIVALLKAVAEADGRFCSLERHEIAQVASELGIDPAEVLNRE